MPPGPDSAERGLEQLFDLQADPGETRNLAGDPDAGGDPGRAAGRARYRRAPPRTPPARSRPASGAGRHLGCPAAAALAGLCWRTVTVAASGEYGILCPAGDGYRIQPRATSLRETITALPAHAPLAFCEPGISRVLPTSVPTSCCSAGVICGRVQREQASSVRDPLSSTVLLESMTARARQHIPRVSRGLIGRIQPRGRLPHRAHQRRLHRSTCVSRIH